MDEPHEDPTGAAAGTVTATSPAPVLVAVAAVFLVMRCCSRRADETDGSVGPIEASVAPGRTGGRLIYAVPAGDGTARLWRWNPLGGEVTRGPVVRDPVALVNIVARVRMAGRDVGGRRRIRRAAVLDSLKPGSVARPVGGGDIVTWTKRGEMVLLVDRGSLRIDAGVWSR